MKRTLLMLVSLCGGAVVGQTARPAVHLDGSALERVLIQGTGTFVHGLVHGRTLDGAIRLHPIDKQKFYGASMFWLRGFRPRAVAFDLHLEGRNEIGFRARLDDPRSHKAGYAAVSVRCKPGWNHFEIPLAKQTTPKGRTLDLDLGLARFQVSTRRKKQSPGFLITRVEFLDEAPPKEVLLTMRLGLREDDDRTRIRWIRDLVRVLPEKDLLRMGLNALRDADTDERARRHWREALARRGSKSLLTALRGALRKAKGPARHELLWIMAAGPSATARKAAFDLIPQKTTSVPDRTALLQGIRRKDATDLGVLVKKLAGETSWQGPSALARALATAANKEAVDGLIEMIAREKHPRVVSDCHGALVGLTHRDLGTDATAWRTWWKVNRGTFIVDSSSNPKGEAYGRFFGIPVSDGRMVFVLDISGSMRDPVSGGPAARHIARSRHLDARKIKERLDLAKEELVHAMAELGPRSTIGVVVYNDATLWLSKSLEKVTPKLRDHLAKRVRRVTASGRTNIHDGLFEAFHPRGKPDRTDLSEGPDTIFLLSDGNPSTGRIRNYGALRDAVLRWNIGRAIRIHTVNVGNADARMLRSIARETGGRFVNLRSEKKPRKED